MFRTNNVVLIVARATHLLMRTIFFVKAVSFLIRLTSFDSVKRGATLTNMVFAFQQDLIELQELFEKAVVNFSVLPR